MIEVARILADGRWHSGTQLAQALGVSRAAVWKRVAAARGSGLTVDAVRGRGYRLRSPFEPLEAEAIAAALPRPVRSTISAIEVLGLVDSTNTRLLERGDSEPVACFAEQQSAGRGRRGRGWVSPFGRNLYFSVAWPFDPAPPAIGAVTLAAGVALAEALRDTGLADIGLKWPNDLVIAGDKLGGILVEHRGEAAGRCRIVLGVGLNLRLDAEDAGAVDQPWTSVAAHLANPPGRNVLAGALLAAVVHGLQQFATEGFDAFRRRWQRLDTLAGRTVTLDVAGQRFAGRAAGIATDGALLVAVGNEQRRFYSGDVSVRAT